MAEIAERVAVVSLRQLIKPLFLLAGCFVAAGLIYLCDGFIRALFGTVTGSVGWIPYAGKVVGAPVHKIEQKLTGTLGAAEQAIDGQIASYFHTLAQLPRSLGSALLSTAEDLWIIAAFAATLLDPLQWRKLYDSLVGKTQAQLLPIGTNAKAANARSKVLTKTVAQGVWPRLREVEHTVERVIPKELKSTRTLAREAEHTATKAWEYLRTHPWLAVTPAFVGAIAVALARLELGWLRCPSLRRIGRGIGCGGFAALEDILFAGGEALIVTDLCDFAAAAETVAQALTPILIELVDVENALIGCHGATAPPPLTMRAPQLPRVSNPLPLAA